MSWDAVTIVQSVWDVTGLRVAGPVRPRMAAGKPVVVNTPSYGPSVGGIMCHPETDMVLMVMSVTAVAPEVPPRKHG